MCFVRPMKTTGYCIVEVSLVSACQNSVGVSVGNVGSDSSES